MIIAPEHIRTLSPYVPGKPIEELERELGLRHTVKLASNENPLGPSPRAVKAISEHLTSIHRYPDGSGYYLKQSLSEKLGVATEQIILGNGSNELLDLIVRTFYRPGLNAVSSDRTFIVYPMVMQAVGGTYRAAPMRDNKYDLTAMAELVDDETLCVFIANPNNPTGTIVRRGVLERFFADIPESVLTVLDEAYFEYVEDGEYPDGLDYVKAGRNVIVLRTFSKIHGLAGLRIGYGIGDPDLVETMNRVREPFNTSLLSQAAALQALEDAAHVERSLKVNREGKLTLYRVFDRLGLSYTPTEANFIWVHTRSDAGKLYEELLRRGVIVRPMGDEHLRITIGSAEENQVLAAALEQSM
jgi:histidinol-phosphate aminotransferase